VEGLNAKELTRVLYDGGVRVMHDSSAERAKLQKCGSAVSLFQINPELALGLSTKKWYGGALYIGKATDVEIDAANGQQIWRVACGVC
jgi:hypothetical protein